VHKFFIDRNLGAVQLPRALRSAGWDVVTLSEHYGSREGETVKDAQWLRLAGERGWVVLMKDKHIRYNEVEQRALIDHGVRAFCLSSGNLSGTDQIDVFLRHEHRIFSLADQPGPFLYVVSQHAVRLVIPESNKPAGTS